MKSKIEIVRNKEQKISNWTGGVTREILIFPRNSDYNKRNFKWRISSATINLNESKFTYLKGIKRIIMILNGKVTLIHEGYYKKTLKKFEKDEFCGEWDTKSIGTCEDFNLMMDMESVGSLEEITILNGESREFILDNTKYKNEYNSFTKVFYVLKGEITIRLKGCEETFNLSEKDAALITLKKYDNESLFKINCDSLNNSEIIMCEVNFNS